MKITANFILLTLLTFISPLSVSTECADHCAFVLTSQSGQEIVINKARALQRMSPFSTFKIANTLIAFETNTVSNLTQLLTYDHDKYPSQPWWPEIWSQQPLTIRAAFQHSVVPIYKTIASEVGTQSMQQFLNQFNYGNKDISSGIDNFWLNESLKINAIEQTAFLKRLFENNLGISSDTVNLLKKVMLTEQTNDYTLYAKTGGGTINTHLAIGWYVGVVVRENDTYYFALNIQDGSFNDVREKRIKMARELLKSFHVI